MSSLNAVEALLTRLSLSNAIPSFRTAGVEKIISLRNLSEDRLKELLPDPEQRQKLTDALTRNTDAAAKVGPPAIAPGPVLAYNDQQGSSESRSGGPQKVCRYFRTSQGCKKGASCNLPHVDGPPLPTDSAPTAPRQRRACRDYVEGGCKYGAECRYNHSDDASREPAGDYVNNDTYSEEVQVPFESVRYLLGNKAEKLQRIHTMCGTSNTRIEKPESYMSHYYIRVKGSKEGVQMARAEIERLVGITSAQNTEARFQYVSHELERNVQSCKMLAAFNLASKGTALEISEPTLKSLVSTFRFQIPAKIDHFWMLTGLGDKEKLEVCSRCIKHMPAVQAIIFVDHKRAVEMEKRASMTSQAFGLPAVQFVHRDQAKEIRLANLEAFKNGINRGDGFKNRLLVTTSDYAKLARKVIIPYVNMVIHFSIPKTKEIYTFQSLCCGRHGTKGVNLMFILNSDASTQREWSESLPLKEMNESDWEKSIQDLQYDAETKTLTPADAEPPANWREQLEAEKAAKPPKAPAATAAPAAAASK